MAGLVVPRAFPRQHAPALANSKYSGPRASNVERRNPSLGEHELPHRRRAQHTPRQVGDLVPPPPPCPYPSPRGRRSGLCGLGSGNPLWWHNAGAGSCTFCGCTVAWGTQITGPGRRTRGKRVSSSLRALIRPVPASRSPAGLASEPALAMHVGVGPAGCSGVGGTDVHVQGPSGERRRATQRRGACFCPSACDAVSVRCRPRGCASLVSFGRGGQVYAKTSIDTRCRRTVDANFHHRGMLARVFPSDNLRARRGENLHEGHIGVRVGCAAPNEPRTAL
ncbi:hypothetical protein BD413DRAFT_160354 [Trametes elegans]|nr:hypothetical protein BD413DRAFT_160354 [Trametes elegans]